MNRGFTLVELLIAMAVSGIIMTGIYSAFKTQQDSYLAQEQVAEMQQNIRAGLDMMVRDIRMAGFTGDGGSNANILDAQVDAISFSADLNEDGDTTDAGENIAYDLYNSTTTGSLTVGRASSDVVIALTESPSGSGHYEATPNHQPFVPEIENIEFFYFLEDGTRTTSPADPSDVRSVEISILARAHRPDRNYKHNKFYCPASHPSLNTTTNLCEDPGGNTLTPWGTNDNYRRRFQTMTVQCRNMGL